MTNAAFPAASLIHVPARSAVPESTLTKTSAGSFAATSFAVGPDLASIGTRAPEKLAAPWKRAGTNAAAELEHHLLVHLYNPRQLAPASTCPSASYLFDKQKPEVRHAGKPLIVSKGLPPVFPKHNAHALVAYLLTQRTDVGLPEAPVPSLVKAAVATPAPALGTTAPAKP